VSLATLDPPDDFSVGLALLGRRRGSGGCGGRRARRGVSLLEVLISIFVLSIGLLSLSIALIPCGRFAVVEAAKADRSGACGRAAMREVKIRRMLNPNSWSDVGRVNNPRPFVIDPLYFTSPNSPAVPRLGTVDRITLLSRATGNAMIWAEAEAIFTWRDELSFDNSPDTDPQLRRVAADRRPRRLVRDSIGVVGPFPELPGEPPLTPPLEPLSGANYSWFLTVTPVRAEAALPPERKLLYSVSAAVCNKRDFTSEQVREVVRFLGNVGYGGGSIELKEPVEVRENEWIMLCDVNVPGEHCHWYRVVSAGESPTRFLSLNGPDWSVQDANGNLTARAVVIDSVVGVYTTAVELDQDPRWYVR
jgi:prepilin-type N-terminal cleavage/methylation domain-containing protein